MYRLTAMSTALTGVMCAIAVVLGLFFADVMLLALFAAVSLLLAMQLFNEKRWAAWLAFFFMLITISMALLGVNSGSYAPNWAFYAIAVTAAISALCLFSILWKSKVAVSGHASTSLN